MEILNNLDSIYCFIAFIIWAVFILVAVFMLATLFTEAIAKENKPKKKPSNKAHFK